MSFIEEIPKGYKTSLYYSSLYGGTGAKKPFYGDDSQKENAKSFGGRNSRYQQVVNYDVAVLEANAHGQNNNDGSTAEMKATRKSNKRLLELDRENYNEHQLAKIEVPKEGFDYFGNSSKNLNVMNKSGRRFKLGSTPNTKRILSSKKNLNNYLDEDTSNILKIWANLETRDNTNQINAVPELKTCSICGNNSSYTCVRCGTRFCSIKCGDTHNETRCSNYAV
ncbi:hypothetical protein PACTADRAFT_47399 [Pachysolen tannophilus NRRL Y-2460]|uniref:HIT-type domain-containing protein n=1 Tax=Pachysolen tannophilus NRRL Y-2460 TaxID=669874 RepID=A0A1E4U0N6_PACTA|nr:hypothetical protein PACTADRAFT_47399 [Pachysolen tannophilus NRRL Y-2460]